jgi:hypothetical protein
MGRGFRSEVVVGLIVFVLFILGAIFFSGTPPLDRIQSLRTWQEADAPPGYLVEVSAENPEGRLPSFGAQFLLLDAFARFRLPPVVRLDQPLGTEQGALAFCRRPFLTGRKDDEEKKLLGEDLEGIAGLHRAGGEVVRAIGNGVVVYARDRGEGWGRVVILGHRLEDGRHVHSLYGGLDKIEVARGALVARGQALGRAGGPPGSGRAALHFEIYEGPVIDPGPGYAPHPMNRIDPDRTILGQRPVDPADLAPEPLGAIEIVRQVFKIDAGTSPDRQPGER